MSPLNPTPVPATQPLRYPPPPALRISPRDESGFPQWCSCSCACTTVEDRSGSDRRSDRSRRGGSMHKAGAGADPAAEAGQPESAARREPPAARAIDWRPGPIDGRLVSLVAPATFEAEQYRALDRKSRVEGKGV